ncbi:MAG: hypothetical protein CVV37_02315 [Nitrospira bacterium HGW-Nitrospira-1]|nr:MAG: hypothetical protein CVV37_02315 [Nitrospira bacterium HGW-Nitrospira-1]
MSRFRNILLLATAILFSIFSQSYSIWALEKDTHKFLNEKVVNNYSIVHVYLKNQLGFEKGVEEVFNGKQLWEWIRDGGQYEDEPIYTRSLNHFHDPLKPWGSAGFKGTFKSSVIWAQDQGAFGSLFGGDWSWKKARVSFYKGLTDLTKTDREKNLADTFRALGQVMHLVQDASVPAHVRNDTHVYVDLFGLKMGYHYEIWVQKNHGILNLSPLSFDKSILNLTPESSAPIPIANIFDTNQYVGSNLNVTFGSSIGIAEYTNANFFSEGTIFKDYSHPTYDDTNYHVAFKYPEVVDAEDGKFDNRVYIRKTVGEADVRLASFSYISYDVIKKGYYDFSPLVLDDKVYNDYAAMLIPRAVGYSAGLLDYFFRGAIDITVPSNGVYSMINATQPGFNPSIATFTAIKLKAKNTTSTGEEMTDGSIQLVVKYKAAQADPFQSGPVQTSNDFSYIVAPETNNIRALSRTTAVELNFDLSQNPILLWATDVYLQVVYHGKLGNEASAVAVGFKDISEPTPIDIFNNMDKICLNGGWYTAGSPEAIAQVDTNNNGIADTNEADVYAHDLKNIYLRFSPYNQNPPYYWASSSAHNIAIPYLYAGAPVRAAYLLSDYMFNKGEYWTLVKTDTNDPWYHSNVSRLWWYSAVKRQRDYSEDSGLCAGAPSCYVDVYPIPIPSFSGDNILGFHTFRNTSMWWGSARIWVNNPYPLDSQCSYDLL